MKITQKTNAHDEARVSLHPRAPRSPLALALAVTLVACTPGGGEATGEAATATTGASTGDPATTSSTADATTTGPTTATTTADATTTAADTADTTDTADTADTTGAPVWRSELYPDDWDPGAPAPDGRSLHDFSYAGYHHGEVELGAELPAMILDVVAGFGADASGESDAAPAFQAALDAAALAGGAIVEVPAGLFRLDGPLTITASRIVLRGLGPDQSRLWFTRAEGMSFKSHVTFRGALQEVDEAPLVADAPARGRELRVADASAYAVGDEVVIGWTITDAFIDEHGMTGVWMAFNGAWQPFFRRRVVAVDPGASPPVVTVDVPLRYPAKTRDQAALRRVTGALREVAVEDLGIADAVAWDDAWSQDQVHVLEFDGVVDGWIRGVASFPSPGAPAEGNGAGRHLQSGGLIVRASNRITVADSHLALPQHRGEGGNGYLFEVRQSSEVLVRDCVGEAGRHNFIQD